jgi:hypothetical protein
VNQSPAANPITPEGYIEGIGNFAQGLKRMFGGDDTSRHPAPVRRAWMSIVWNVKRLSAPRNLPAIPFDCSLLIGHARSAAGVRSLSSLPAGSS